jgi:MOSC domain-containing protein YiiM
MLLTLERAFGHIDLGVYARVTAPGTISIGDPVDVA